VTCPPWARARHNSLIAVFWANHRTVNVRHLMSELAVSQRTILRRARKLGIGWFIDGKLMFTEAEAELLRGGK